MSNNQSSQSINNTVKPLFSQKLLNIGFGIALILASACLAMSGLYLYSFLTSTNNSVEEFIQSAENSKVSENMLIIAINVRMVMVRIALHSCGVFVGMSFGFLGFALFLLGIKGEMNVEA